LALAKEAGKTKDLKRMSIIKVTLIATGHFEKGICTSTDLVKIIEQTSPDVIFEETPPDKFDTLYSNKLRDSLESKAIKLYLQKRALDHFPVDMTVDD
jgi:hypothetical protein